MFIEYFFNFIISAFASLFVIYFIFWYLKPNILISKNIVKSNTENGNTYKIKLINNSKFSANDVKVEMWKKTEYKATSNSRALNESVIKVKVSTSEWLNIPKHTSNSEIKKTNYAPHCVTVRILDENPEFVLDPSNNQNYEFKISVKHGLSNISKTFSMQYNDIKCLKNGRFVFGNSIETEEI